MCHNRHYHGISAIAATQVWRIQQSKNLLLIQPKSLFCKAYSGSYIPRISSWRPHRKLLLPRVKSQSSNRKVTLQSRARRSLRDWVSSTLPDMFTKADNTSDTSQWPLLLKNYDKLLVRSSHFTPIPTVSGVMPKAIGYR